jgi:uncharacterized protein (DUF1697 family)
MSYVILLRAVNVGGNNKVPMADLRTALTNQGLEKVSSYIASGNVFADSSLSPDALAGLVGSVIHDSFGLDIAVQVRTHSELVSIAERNPFGHITDLSKLLITFLGAEPTPFEVTALRTANPEPEQFVIDGTTMYTYYPNGLGKSKLTPTLIDRKLKTVSTTRNFNTLLKLIELSAEVAEA